MAIEYPSELISGIPEIDQQHQDLFFMYNEFSEALGDGKSEEAVFRLFASLEDFTANHFSYEERLIEKSGYPKAEVHIQEHAHTIETLKRFKEIIHSEPLTKELLLSIARQLIRVLVNHVKNCDVRVCRHLLGLKELNRSAAAPCAADGRDKRIGEIMVDLKMVRPESVELALDRQREIGQRLGDLLVAMGAAKAEDVIEAYAIQIGILGKNPESAALPPVMA